MDMVAVAERNVKTIESVRKDVIIRWNGFVAESEAVKEPVEVRLGKRLKVKYGPETDRVDIVLGRNPNNIGRTKFDDGGPAGLKVFLRDERGGSLRDLSRRAMRLRYSAGEWKFTNLKTGKEKIITGLEPDLRNLVVDVAPGYQLRVGGVSQKSGERGQRIESFIFERKRS